MRVRARILLYTAVAIFRTVDGKPLKAGGRVKIATEAGKTLLKVGELP